MLFGLDGVEVGLIIVFFTLFGAILSGFPVAFAIAGAGIISFGLIAVLDSSGLLIHQAVDQSSAAYAELLAAGVKETEISLFRYPELPTLVMPVFERGWEYAMDRNVAFIVNRINERVLAGQSIETLLAVLMFVMMGITLERSKIANDLLTTMARVFGPLPGGLAVSVVVVGAFLAASTGIVGATVVTMGLLSLPTMLRNGYSPELSTGVIAASGTLGQIIPPSIVIVLLGTLAGDIYSAAQETRAVEAGCRDALTYLGSPAVLSVGTLFQAALLPGLFLAALYALYAFGFALARPHQAPAVVLGAAGGNPITRNEAITWFLAAPTAVIVGLLMALQVGIVGSQSLIVDSYTDASASASLRTQVSEECQASMIALHGQSEWDQAVEEQAQIMASGGAADVRKLTPEEMTAAIQAQGENAAPIGTGLAIGVVILSILFFAALGVNPSADPRPIFVGLGGAGLMLLIDGALISAFTSDLGRFARQGVAIGLVIYGLRHALPRLAANELIRVVFPPLVLIIAVLGSILGGLTNPTPAAALGAAGALMLAAYRKLTDAHRSGKVILNSTFALIILLIVGINFDLRIGAESTTWETWVAYCVAFGAYLFALFGLLYSCYVLWTMSVLSPVVRETAKVTSMVFTILIGSQLLNLVVISFGGEHYIQQFLKSFDNEVTVFLIVMVVLFVLGFVLDFLEIIYIVVPIVGPVIYGGSFDPSWVTIMIAVNLQTSFLTPPFGFALFYLRGVAPASVTTMHIYRGVTPFVLIQVLGLVLLWTFPVIVTLVPNLLS